MIIDHLIANINPLMRFYLLFSFLFFSFFFFNFNSVRKRTVSTPHPPAATLRRNTFRKDRPRSVTDSVFIQQEAAAASAATSTIGTLPPLPSSDILAAMKRVPIRVIYNETSNTLSVPPEISMEAFLVYICQKLQLDFESHTLKDKGQDIEMDRPLGYYIQEHKLSEVSVVRNEKAYSTMCVSEGDVDVMILQMSEGR